MYRRPDESYLNVCVCVCVFIFSSNRNVNTFFEKQTHQKDSVNPMNIVYLTEKLRN